MLLANCRPFVSSFSRGRSLPNSFSSIYTSAAEGRKGQKQCRSNFGEFCDDFGQKLLSTGFKKTVKPALQLQRTAVAITSFGNQGQPVVWLAATNMKCARIEARAQSALAGADLRVCFYRASLCFALALASCAWGANTFHSVYISEFLADDRHTLQDAEGDYPGWIELYNGGSDLVNLAGWYLSDTRTNLTKWRFPGVCILPDSYLVVFSSGKDRTNDLARSEERRVGKECRSRWSPYH